MNDPKPLRFVQEPPPGGDAGTAYAGRTRYTQLEYEALLGNLPLGIAFTRERRFFLCNPKFAEMFGYGPDELIGMASSMSRNRPSVFSRLSFGPLAKRKRQGSFGLPGIVNQVASDRRYGANARARGKA